jgi:ankyrin repeat protein
MSLQQLNLFVPLAKFVPWDYVCASRRSQESNRAGDALSKHLCRNDLEAAMSLIDRSNVNLATLDGITALHIAIKKNDSKRVEQLLALGADIYKPNVFYQNGIELAVHFAGAEVWNKIISAGSIEANTPFHSFNKGGLNYKNSLLNFAAEQGNLPAVKALIAAGADINFVNGIGYKPLDSAILAGAIDVVKYLAEQIGADLFQEELKRTVKLQGIDYPLLQLSLFAHEEAVRPQGRGFSKTDAMAIFKLLLDKADPLQKNNRDETVVEAATRLGKQMHLEVLVDKFGQDISATNGGRLEEAIAAIKQNSPRKLESLFILGLDPNSHLKDSSTLLHLAIRKARGKAASRIVELILEYPDIKVNAQTKTSLYKRAPLHMAVLSNNRKALAALINYPGIDLNIQDRFGYTPLHYAVKENNIFMVLALLKAGANRDLKAKGKTPLQFGLVLGDGVLGKGKTKTIIDYLWRLQKQEKDFVDIDSPQREFSLLDKIKPADQRVYGIFTAINDNKSSEIPTLLVKGLDPNLCFWSSSYSPLHYAVRKKDIVAIGALVADPRTNVNAVTDQCCFTPLHLAVLRGHRNSVAALLLSNRINPNQRDIFGATALHYAVKLGDETVIELLTQHGAKTKVLTKDHDPLTFAYLLGGRKAIKKVLQNPDLATAA